MCFFKKEIDISVEQEPQNTITLETDGGVSDYNLLSNKPKINGVTVENERDGNVYGLVNQSDLEGYVKKNENPTLNSGSGYNITFTNGAGDTADISFDSIGTLKISKQDAIEGEAKIEFSRGGGIKIFSGWDIIIRNTVSNSEVSVNAGGVVIKSGFVDVRSGFFGVNDAEVITEDRKASQYEYGIVQVDGTTITANDGIISAVGGGGGAPTLTWYTGVTGTTVTVSDTTGATLVKVYKNGLLLQPTEDYTISGTTLTLVTALVATDKITTEVF